MILFTIAMESLQQTAVRVIGPLLHQQPTTPGKVAFAWSIAAGGMLARAGRAEYDGRGTLRVTARSATWARELERARPVVLERLRHLVGPDVVRTVIVISPE
jgi:predicted nucleic acid-binding Zn ribbon protein